MLNYSLFKGELKGKSLKDIKLNYEVNDIQIRKVILERTLEGFDEFFEEYFNQNEGSKSYFNVNLNKSNGTSENDGVCKKIEGLANYLLYCDEAKIENRKSEHPYLTSYKTTSIAKNESDFEHNHEVDKNIEKESDVGNYKKVGKLSVTKKDIDDIPTMKQIQEVIDVCKSKIETINEFMKQFEGNADLTDEEKTELSSARLEKTKYEKLASIMKDNQKFVKMMVKKPIYFKAPLGDTTQYDLDCIDLGNPHHVVALLDNYSNFKEITYEDLTSDLRFIMMDLDNLIENTDLLPHEKDILMMKIDGCNAEEIKEHLSDIGLDWNDDYISRIYRNTIPKKIAEQYKEEYNDWYYREVEYGEYKQCSKCGEIKLVSEFSPDSTKTSGFKSQCKKCRNMGTK